MLITDGDEDDFKYAVEAEQEADHTYRVGYFRISCGKCGLTYPAKTDLDAEMMVFVCPNCRANYWQTPDFSERLAAEEFETWRMSDLLTTDDKVFLRLLAARRYDPDWDRLYTGPELP